MALAQSPKLDTPHTCPLDQANQSGKFYSILLSYLSTRDLCTQEIGMSFEYLDPQRCLIYFMILGFFLKFILKFSRIYVQRREKCILGRYHIKIGVLFKSYEISVTRNVPVELSIS